MKIAYIDIINFRGISKAKIFFTGHNVIIGDNNAGKSTIIEAIDLVLGPDRLSRVPVIDEHDFHNGHYIISEKDHPCIEIEIVVKDLSLDQIARFKNNLEFWDNTTEVVLPPGSINEVDNKSVEEALRIKFIGSYNKEEDDFEGETFYCWPAIESGIQPRFSKADKRECGFLYLRALRTGARALSMERGSLLDIILRIREIRPKMWEGILGQLRDTTVGSNADASGVNEVLQEVQSALREFVPIDWGSMPHLKVSDLTREHLRKTLTVFMSTGESQYFAPFQHQGMGTINTMVLALLSMIAEAKNSVIFAMEEPEIAIPPYTQKRIVASIKHKSSQAIFTSHSPFVLEEFSPADIILVQRDNRGVLTSQSVTFPKAIKAKDYNAEFRLRFSEALLAKRILLTEGATEALAYPAAGRRLSELDSNRYSSLEAMGVAIFDVKSETNIVQYGDYFTNLGKMVFAVFDKQAPGKLSEIIEKVKYPYESSYTGFEDLMLTEIDQEILKKFYLNLIRNDDWPSHLNKIKVKNTSDFEAIKAAMFEYLKWNKADLGITELIGMCTERKQIPVTIRKVIRNIKKILETPVEQKEMLND